MAPVVPPLALIAPVVHPSGSSPRVALLIGMPSSIMVAAAYGGDDVDNVFGNKLGNNVGKGLDTCFVIVI